MKICHISTGYPLSLQGGITNYVRALAESQQAEGNSVWVIAGDPGQAYSYQVKSYASQKIKPFSFSLASDKQALEELKSFFAQQAFDLIHIHMMLDIDWDLYEVIKDYHYVISLHDYFYLCPRVVMLHNNGMPCGKYDEDKCRRCVSLLEANDFIAYAMQRVKSKFGITLPSIPQQVTAQRFIKLKKLLENADMLLPVSARVRQIYEESGIVGNYQVLHIGNITADRFCETFEKNPDKQYIDVVMLGTLNYIKGADLFIKLAQALDKSKFHMHFYGRSADYAKKIAKAGIIDHGPYQQKDLPGILSDSDLGLVLSVWEDNGPQVVMEMLNNHVPVVGTRMGGIPDFVNRDNGFLFDPYSQEEFRHLVKELNALTREDIIRLKQNITPTMTTDAHAKEIAQVYQNVVNNG